MAGEKNGPNQNPGSKRNVGKKLISPGNQYRAKLVLGEKARATNPAKLGVNFPNEKQKGSV